jgi:hypothetical protein
MVAFVTTLVCAFRQQRKYRKGRTGAALEPEYSCIVYSPNSARSGFSPDSFQVTVTKPPAAIVLPAAGDVILTSAAARCN